MFSPTFVVFGSPNPVFEVKASAAARPTRIVASAASPSAVSAFYAAARRANLIGASHISLQEENGTTGESRASATDLEGNVMEAVYVHSQPPTSQGGRILGWNLDANTSSVGAARSAVGSAAAPAPSRPGLASIVPMEGEGGYRYIKRSFTSSVVETAPPKEEESTGFSTGTIVGAALGALAAGAAIGAGISYVLGQKEKDRALRQEFDAPPPMQRRSTFPEPFPSDQQPRYVEMERTVEKVRYPEQYAPPGSNQYPHPAYTTRQPQASSPVEEIIEERPALSRVNSGSRVSPRKPLMIADVENKSNIGNIFSEHKSNVGKQREPELVSVVSRREPERMTTVSKREPDRMSTIDEREPERMSTVSKREPDRMTSVSKREPDRMTSVSKREPDRMTSVSKREPTERMSTVSKREPNPSPPSPPSPPRESRDKENEPRNHAGTTTNKPPPIDFAGQLQQELSRRRRPVEATSSNSRAPSRSRKDDDDDDTRSHVSSRSRRHRDHGEGSSRSHRHRSSRPPADVETYVSARGEKSTDTARPHKSSSRSHSRSSKTPRSHAPSHVSSRDRDRRHRDREYPVRSKEKTNWRDLVDDDDSSDDKASVAPSESISCVGTREERPKPNPRDLPFLQKYDRIMVGN
ncbi:hypothetical protein F4808DRAFT_253402 [Astrocystis sublimbata]|nr:hypothetical protein F4808DRAFT_253402 [Astrocystis sublimbata]